MRSESGFTLLELLVAVTILALGLIATVSMQGTAIRANALAQRTTAASAVARAAMDEVISRDSSDPFFDVGLVAAPHDLDPQSVAMTQAVQGVTYTATITVTPNATVNAVVVPNLTRIDLTVTGNDRTITLTELKRAL